MKLRLPAPLAENMKAQMIGTAKDLVAHMAYTLGVPKDEAIKRVLGEMPSVVLDIVACSDYEVSCCVPVAMGSSVQDYELCRKPCILNTGRCMGHQQVETIPDFETNQSIRLTRLQGIAEMDMGPLWCDENTGYVYNRQQEHVGHYSNGVVEIVKSGGGGTTNYAEYADADDDGDAS